MKLYLFFIFICLSLYKKKIGLEILINQKNDKNASSSEERPTGKGRERNKTIMDERGQHKSTEKQTWKMERKRKEEGKSDAGEEKDTEKQRWIGLDEIFTGSTPCVRTFHISIYTHNK